MNNVKEPCYRETTDRCTKKFNFLNHLQSNFFRKILQQFQFFFLKQQICYCIFDLALMVVGFFFISKAPGQYLQKKLLMAFLESEVFEKI